MAVYSLKELLLILRQHPSYSAHEFDTPIEQALYISFDGQEGARVESTVFGIVDGRELVVDVDESGLIRGIEII